MEMEIEMEMRGNRNLVFVRAMRFSRRRVER